MNEIKIGDKVLVEGILQDKAEGMSKLFVGGVDVIMSVKRVHPMPTKTYEDGMREAWETAQSLFTGKFYDTELEELFGTKDPAGALLENTAAEAAAKIAAWEDRKQIHIGDVVDVGEKGTDSYVGGAVVTGRNKDRYFLLFNDGEIGASRKKYLTKTGRTVDIKAVLEAISSGD